MRRSLILAWASVLLACGTTPPPPPPFTPVALSDREAHVFQQICAECHMRPGINSPTIGDDEAWQPRRAKGLDVLLTNTIEGRGQMPPLGTCSFCSEDELRRLVAFVSGLGMEALAEESASP